jgi:flavodoxin
MRSIIIYYSYSGNTRRVAEFLAEYLKVKGEVAVIGLKPQDESDKFFRQCLRGFKHIKAELGPVNFDLSPYDLICFGTPVWAFGPAPAMNAYLDKCFGLKGKEVVLFTTYGSGVGNKRCLDYMQDILVQKEVKEVKRFSVQQFKVNDTGFILAQIKET